MIANTGDLLAVLDRVYGPSSQPPEPLHLVRGVAAVRDGADLGETARRLRTTHGRLRLLAEAVDPAAEALGGSIPILSVDREVRVRRSLGQLILGHLAERAFEEIYKGTVGTSELRLEDDRSERTDTDYRVINGAGRRVFRVNIKFFGSPFRKAPEMVGLPPEDCFALATYKIKSALDKQDAEHLPYIFVIVGVPGLTGETVGQTLPENLVHLSGIAFESPRVKGKRSIEDAIVRSLVEGPDPATQERLRENYQRMRSATWYALSARKARDVMGAHLYERVYALRVRGFTRNYRGAEVDMHFSLTKDLTPLEEFLRVLRDDGLPGLVSRLERGTF